MEQALYRRGFTQGVVPGLCGVQMSGARMWERRCASDSGRTGDVSRALGSAAAIQIAVEASWPDVVLRRCPPSDGSRGLCGRSARKTRLKAGYAAKTDRLDARRLADALRRASIMRVYVPPPAIRELREVCRGRYQLVKIRTRARAVDPRAVAAIGGGDDAPVKQLYGARGAGLVCSKYTCPIEAERTLRRLERLLACRPRRNRGRPIGRDGRTPRRIPLLGALDTMVGIRAGACADPARGDR